MNNASIGASGHLANLGILRFVGPDASTFLQGQLSNDTARLHSADSTLLAAYSTAQGRVIAIMTLVPHSSGLLAIVPQALVTATAERLRKFVMRAKVKIDIPGDELCVVGQCGPAALIAAQISIPTLPQGYVETDTVGVARRGAAQRFYVIGAADRLRSHGLSGDENDSHLIDNSWRLAEIRDGRSQVYSETTEAFVAQMLNLDVLDGISFNKGCYIGQEIIARTQHLGRIKRRMFRLQLPTGVWTVGSALRLADGRGGRLVELAEVAGDAEEPRVEALAVLNLEPAVESDDATGTPGIAAIELPLPYNLTAPAV